VPSNIATYATALYSEHETIKTAINAISDLAGVIAYENKPHTETRKIATYNLILKQERLLPTMKMVALKNIVAQQQQLDILICVHTLLLTLQMK